MALHIRPRGSERGLIAGYNPFQKGVSLWLRDDLTVKLEVNYKDKTEVVGQLISNPLTLNEWAHIAMSYDWGTGVLKLFINGQEEGQTSKHHFSHFVVSINVMQSFVSL